MDNQPKVIDAFAFDPPEGLRSRDYAPTRPESEDAIRGQIQGVSDQLRDHINAVTAALGAQEKEASGAHRIGAPPVDGLPGGSVAAQLASLKEQVDGVTMGQLPAGSVVSEKLADGAVQAHHLADGALTARSIGMDLTICDEWSFRENGEFTVPESGIYELIVIAGGSGGRGGGDMSTEKNMPGSGGIGGQAGQFAAELRYLPRGLTVPITVGAGGTGGGSASIQQNTGALFGHPGTAGGSSSFGTLLSAANTGKAGGKGSEAYNTYLYGTAGGAGGSSIGAGRDGTRVLNTVNTGGEALGGAGSGGDSGNKDVDEEKDGKPGGNAVDPGCGGGGGGGACITPGARGGQGGDGAAGLVRIRRIYMGRPQKEV